MTSSHDAFQALHGSLSDLELAIIRWAEAYNMTNDRLEELAAALARLRAAKEACRKRASPDEQAG